MKLLNCFENATVNKYNGVLFIASKFNQDNFEILKQDRIVYCHSRVHNSEGIIHIYLREKTSTAFRVFDFDVFNFYEKIKIEGGGVRFSSDTMEAYYSNSQIDEFNYKEFWYKGELVWSRKEKNLSDSYPGSGLISPEFVLRKSYTDSNKIVCSDVLTDQEIWTWNAKEYFVSYDEEYENGKLDHRIQAYKEYFLVQWTYAWGKQLKITLNRESGEIQSIFDVQFYFGRFSRYVTIWLSIY